MCALWANWRGRAAWLAAALVLLAPSFASAAWLGYKNETNAPVSVQTAIIVNGKVMRGAAHVLYPGEIAWDNIPSPGPRQVSVYDPKANNRLVAQETINVANQDIFLAVQMQAQPQVPGKAPVPPIVRLVASKAPGPPGVVPPKDAPKGNTPTPPGSVPPRSNLPPTSKTDPPVEKPKDQPKTPPAAEKPKDQPKEQPKTPPPSGESKSKSG